MHGIRYFRGKAVLQLGARGPECPHIQPVCIPGSHENYEKLVDYAISKGAEVRRLVVSVSMDLFHYDLPDAERERKAQTSEHAAPRCAVTQTRIRTITNDQEAHTEFSRVFSSDIVRAQEAIPPRYGTILGLIRPELLHIPHNAFGASLLDRSSRFARLTRRFD